MGENLSAPMNDDNKIDTESALFGFLAEYAQQNRFAVSINRLFKERDNNAMCIPMNIRPDDIYFTVAGMREAKLTGAALGREYVDGVMEQLDFMSDEVKACGFCDTIIIKDKKIHGELASGKAIAKVLQTNGVKKVALYGAGKLAKSIMTHIQESGVEELVLLHDKVEQSMALMQAFDCANISVDIDRVQEAQEIDLTGFDAFINATPDEPKLKNIDAKTVIIDLKDDSNLQHYHAHFVDNTEFSKSLSEVNYTIWMEK